MADSRDKGMRGEYQIRDTLRESTGLQWERVPGSGGYGAQHGLKGDIYLPHATGKMSKYAIEVKWYKDEQLTSNILKATTSQIERWWEQTTREAGEMNAKPMLVFKKDRGTWLACFEYGDAIDNYIGFLEQSDYIMIQKAGTVLVICDFNKWLESVNLEDLIK